MTFSDILIPSTMQNYFEKFQFHYLVMHFLSITILRFVEKGSFFVAHTHLDRRICMNLEQECSDNGSVAATVVNTD